MTSPGRIRHVLLDADGVLQELPGGWLAAVAPYAGEVGDVFLQDAWHVEKPALRGEADFLDDLPAVLARHGLDVSTDELYRAVWHSIEVDETSMLLVERLRSAGYGVHLGTNQERHRAAFMRGHLGYDDRFDVSVYSCEIGVAKPDPAYFERAVAMIGSAAHEVLFVDDRADNVEGARAAGLAGVHWDLAEGHDLLLARLAEHGVAPHAA